MSRAIMDGILASRRQLVADVEPAPRGKVAEEGGCGVVGFAATVPLGGRILFEPARRMHNRGNGKGGGIAAAGFEPAQLGVDAATLKNAYLLQLALLDPEAEAEVERDAVSPRLEILHKTRIQPALDHRELGLDVRPPDVVRYVVRAKEDVRRKFAEEHGLQRAAPRAVEDEIVFQNSFRLNQQFYASLGEKRAFVLSHGRDLLIFKIVGYAEEVVRYYGLDDFQARIWIAHQRYPTRGRVWHPAGSHPFAGMNEALVHNGDFANYHSVSEYLRQHHIVPQFLTDTEVAVLLYDLWSRVYGYPLEAVIEALAPTTELDFDRLPSERQRIYRALSALHIHGSPDGPWFFIIASSDPDNAANRLLGITDTAMLRPQVFALQRGEASIGLVASEKQAIDNTLAVLAAEDPRFRTVADRYWNARGGSYTDGGAFAFELQRDAAGGGYELRCTDKFGRPVESPGGALPEDDTMTAPGTAAVDRLQAALTQDAVAAFEVVRTAIPGWSPAETRWALGALERAAESSEEQRDRVLEVLTLLNDRRFDCGDLRRSVVVQLARESIDRLLDGVPSIARNGASSWRRIDWTTREQLRAPVGDETTLVLCAREFPPEGEDCDARLSTRAHGLGWRRFVVYGLKGQRFTGCGLGPDTGDVRIDVYGSSGDYLASGVDGLRLHVHDNAQDQLAQIMKAGELVIHGDVGQTFLYGGKGGEVYVLGNAGGRPLINAVGKPRVVINGTALDYLAESFMAGDPLRGGGFVILNGVRFDDHGDVVELDTPYPGANLFSLASGGAIYVRDPRRLLVDEQLNAGKFSELTPEDWALIEPYLEKNEQLFGIERERHLLTVDGEQRPPEAVYRKVSPANPPSFAKSGVPECAQGQDD